MTSRPNHRLSAWFLVYQIDCFLQMGVARGEVAKESYTRPAHEEPESVPYESHTNPVKTPPELVSSPHFQTMMGETLGMRSMPRGRCIKRSCLVCRCWRYFQHFGYISCHCTNVRLGRLANNEQSQLEHWYNDHRTGKRLSAVSALRLYTYPVCKPGRPRRQILPHSTRAGSPLRNATNYGCRISWCQQHLETVSIPATSTIPVGVGKTTATTLRVTPGHSYMIAMT